VAVAREGYPVPMADLPPSAVTDALRQELHELTASICKALNDPKRLLLLYALGDGPQTVTQLCEVLEAPQSNTSQHLAILRERGLVEATRQGNNVRYSLRHPEVLDALGVLRAVMASELERRNAVLSG
jgi:DNA-binding transcriptional ArsR family regulator